MKPMQSSSFPSSIAILFFLFLLSSPTSNAVMTADVVLSRKLNVTADQAWPLLADYCNIYAYAPLDVSFCTSGVAPNKPGLIRYISVKLPSPLGIDGTIVEWEEQELVAISSKNRLFELIILANNRGLGDNSGVVQQVLKKGNCCQLKWAYNVDLGVTYTPETFHANITLVVSLIADKIERAIALST